MKIFLLLLRLVLGGTLVYAGVLKMADPLAFADSIAGFQIVSHVLINLVALSLPPFEILLGLVLIVTACVPAAAFDKSRKDSTEIGGWKRAVTFAPLTATYLFAAFVFVLAQAMLRGIEADCGCFGGGSSLLESFSPIAQMWFSLLRALALCLAALWLWRRLTRR